MDSDDGSIGFLFEEVVDGRTDGGGMFIDAGSYGCGCISRYFNSVCD